MSLSAGIPNAVKGFCCTIETNVSYQQEPVHSREIRRISNIIIFYRTMFTESAVERLNQYECCAEKHTKTLSDISTEFVLLVLDEWKASRSRPDR